MVKRRLALAFIVLAVAMAIVGLARRREPVEPLFELPEEPRVPDASEVDSEEAYVTLRSLDDSRTMEHTAVVMQGGGNEQIYVTVPVKYVGCDEATLRALLAVLDGLEWNDPPRASLSFELAPIGSGIFGGMGGAPVIDGVWVHPRFEASGLRATVAAVIYGRSAFDDVRAEFPRSLTP